MADFKKLLVWQKAHTMALDAHGSQDESGGPITPPLEVR